MTKPLGPKCRHGHWYTDANTFLYKTSKGGIGRMCRTCKQARERAYRQANRDTLTPKALAHRAEIKAQQLAPDDPRHGTFNGYQNLGCRCEECRAANATAQRIKRLKGRARDLGIALPRDRNEVRSVGSLDAKAEQRFGMDRILTGTIWDDPTADQALAG